METTKSFRRWRWTTLGMYTRCGRTTRMCFCLCRRTLGQPGRLQCELMQEQPWGNRRVAADANGHVVVTWLGGTLAGNSNNVAVMQPTCTDGTTSCWAQWNVYAAETVNGHAAVPTFTQSKASDHIIHSGTICTGGTGCSNGDSRALADFFQVALDTQHRANIAYADDHLASPLCSTQSPGHCASNDPQSFRVAVPYFTYQLKTDKKIVTTGLCAR